MSDIDTVVVDGLKALDPEWRLEKPTLLGGGLARQTSAKRSRLPNQASGVRNVSFMRQAPKNETAAAAMIR